MQTRHRTILILACAAATSAAHSAETVTNADASTRQTQREVIVAQNQNKQYLVRGSINRVPVVFLVDTGASVVSIPETISRHLRLRHGRHLRAQTAGGIITAYETELDQVDIGDIRLHRVQAAVNPSDGSSFVLLGQSALHALAIEQRDGLLYLRQTVEPEAPAPVPPPPQQRFVRSVRDCVGSDGRIDPRVLRCMRGE